MKATPSDRELIESVNNIDGLTFCEFFSEVVLKSGKKRYYRRMRIKTSSEEIYEPLVCMWTRGVRPPRRYFQNILQEASDFGLTEVTKKYRDKETRTGMCKEPCFDAVTPSGETFSATYSQWIEGMRPQRRHMKDIKAEAAEYGIENPKIVLKEEQNGSVRQNFRYISGTLPNGKPYEASLSNWIAGSRPFGRVGRYCETAFERTPSLKLISALLYYVRFDDELTGERFYKIGVRRKGKKRFSTNHRGYTVTIISEDEMSMFDAWDKEQECKRKFAALSYAPSRPFHGQTECFSCDVLSKDS